MRARLIGGAALAALLTAPAAAEDFGGLPEGEGQEEVFYNCSYCHSLRTVTAQHLSRSRWGRILDEMVQVQGMPELEEDTRAAIHDYLVEHFGFEGED